MHAIQQIRQSNPYFKTLLFAAASFVFSLIYIIVYLMAKTMARTNDPNAKDPK